MAFWKLKSWVDPDYPSQEQLENLQYYKYAATDKSLLSQHILRHYWNWAVTLFPTWMAPNLITLTGLMLMMANMLVIILVVPDLSYDQETPRWIYFSFAAGLWLYSTLDNVDGKQARRTGTSSPLGELFDHGCDALNCTYVALMQAAALGLGHSAESLTLFLVTVVGFYLTTAEEYYTGVLNLGIVNGPTEGILLSCLAFVFSGFYGAGAWHTPIESVGFLSGVASYLPPGMHFASLFVWLMVFFFIATHLPFCVSAIHKATKEHSLKHRLKMAYNLAVPITLYTLAVALWPLSKHSVIFEKHYFILYVMMVGILFGWMASNIILAHLTKSPFPSFTGTLLGLWIAVLLVRSRILSPEAEPMLIGCYFVIAAMMYSIWVSMVIDGFCRYLGIRCLVIRERVVPTRAVSVEEQDALLQAQEEGSSAPQPSTYNTFQS